MKASRRGHVVIYSSIRSLIDGTVCAAFQCSVRFTVVVLLCLFNLAACINSAVLLNYAFYQKRKKKNKKKFLLLNLCVLDMQHVRNSEVSEVLYLDDILKYIQAFDCVFMQCYATDII